MADHNKEELERAYQEYKYQELLQQHSKLKENYLAVWAELERLQLIYNIDDTVKH